MKNECSVIDYSKHHYEDKGWKKLKELQSGECSGKVKKWRCATCKDFTEVKKGILVYAGSPVIINDKFGGCDFNTKDGKHCMTHTFVDGMREPFGNFKVIKQSDGKTTLNLIR